MAICKWRDMSAEADGGRKITNVNIANIIAYNTRDSKTENGKYIYCHKCNHELLGADFISSTMERELYNNRSNITHPYDEFYISWGKEITADKAFELSQAIASRFLGEDYQYMITTHVDKDHIHSHFLFNCSNLRTHKMFDHSRSHRIQFLRNINDSIAKENGLSVIETAQKKTTISQGEYYSRKHQRSFKFKAQLLIDQIILESCDYNDFLQRLSKECKLDASGKYAKIKLDGMKKYIRLKSLGTDYSARSILYRIQHKDPSFVRHPQFKYYDLNDEKFQAKQSLRNWAIRQNIKLSFEQAKVLEEIKNITTERSLEDQLHELYKQSAALQEKILHTDDEIEYLQNKVLPALLEYPLFLNSLIIPFKLLKNPDDKTKFKKTHYHQFKRYDQIISILKSQDISLSKTFPSQEQINTKISSLVNSRNDIYTEYIDLDKQISQLQYFSSIISAIDNSQRNNHSIDQNEKGVLWEISEKDKIH